MNEGPKILDENYPVVKLPADYDDRRARGCVEEIIHESHLVRHPKQLLKHIHDDAPLVLSNEEAVDFLKKYRTPFVARPGSNGELIYGSPFVARVLRGYVLFTRLHGVFCEYFNKKTKEHPSDEMLNAMLSFNSVSDLLHYEGTGDTFIKQNNGYWLTTEGLLWVEPAPDPFSLLYVNPEYEYATAFDLELLGLLKSWKDK